ncbi:MAG: deoxyribose-phosphate aldolase [Thermoplasmata archaeon]
MYLRISKSELAKIPSKLTKEKVAGLIDHTELKPHVLTKKIHSLCDEAERYGFASICVNSARVNEAVEYIKAKEYDVLVCSVVGFPLGQMKIEAKAFETKLAVEDGAEEIDTVINVGKLRELSTAKGEEKEKIHAYLLKDVGEVVKAADGKTVKVILETGFLTDEEITEGCKISVEAGAHFVKTSTGFGPMGALPAHLKLMRETVGRKKGVKASGGVTNFLDMLRCIYACANEDELLNPVYFRVGTSSGINIVNTVSWLKYTDNWLIDEVPCRYCPSNFVSKLPEEIKEYYVAKCRNCQILTPVEIEERRKHHKL